MTIIVDGEREERIRAEAARRGTNPEALILHAIDEVAPAAGSDPVLWNGMTVDEWVRSSQDWIRSHEPWPDLPDEALTREGIYGDHA